MMADVVVYHLGQGAVGSAGHTGEQHQDAGVVLSSGEGMSDRVNLAETRRISATSFGLFSRSFVLPGATCLSIEAY
jgi:hypothetical protein